MITCFILLSFYSVVGGWIVIYLFKSLSGGLHGLSEKQYAELFAGTISNPFISVFAHFIFMAITIYVVSRGVAAGIERANKWMMPGLFILLIIIMIRSLTRDGSAEGFEFILKPDPAKISPETLLFAMGQAFFTLSIGVSIMVTYSSYVSKKESIPQSAISIVIMNILVAFLAGMAIFPVVFASGQEPDQGSVLIFNVLPVVFSKISYGMVFFTGFLILFLFAALTSAFSMLEMIVAIASKGEKKKRKKYTWIIGLLIFFMGIPSALSFGALNNIVLFDKTIFDIADFLVSNILMPLGALLISLFIPLKIPRQRILEELSSGSGAGKKYLQFGIY